MSIWFDGQVEIECSIQQVKTAFEDLGEHFVGVVSRMPGLKDVSLVEQGTDHVTIKTNEGLMTRTNISTHIEAERVAAEYDEVYQAGSKVTTTSHFEDEFTASGAGVSFHAVIRGVEAPGILGFLYRHFGSNKIGNAFLKAHKDHLEQNAP